MPYDLTPTFIPEGERIQKVGEWRLDFECGEEKYILFASQSAQCVEFVRWATETEKTKDEIEGDALKAGYLLLRLECYLRPDNYIWLWPILDQFYLSIDGNFEIEPFKDVLDAVIFVLNPEGR